MPILQPRNLLILSGPFCLAVGFGLAALWRCQAGKPLAQPRSSSSSSVSASMSRSRVLGSTGDPLGMHTTNWPNMATALRNDDPAGPVVTFKAPATDPIHYYLADLQPHRLTPDDAAALDAGQTWRSVHWQGKTPSVEVLSVLTGERGGRLELRRQVGPFAIYQVHLPPPGKPQPEADVRTRAGFNLSP